jgi:hypothetical protein
MTFAQKPSLHGYYLILSRRAGRSCRLMNDDLARC